MYAPDRPPPLPIHIGAYDELRNSSVRARSVLWKTTLLVPSVTPPPSSSAPLRCQRPSAFSSSFFVILERPWMFFFLASLYSWSRVGPPGPCRLPDRLPPRCWGDTSLVDVLLACFDSPACARFLLTVRAAISFARLSLAPRSFAESFTCSY